MPADGLFTDFSSLNGPNASNWILGFLDMAENAFADSGNAAPEQYFALREEFRRQTLLLSEKFAAGFLDF